MPGNERFLTPEMFSFLLGGKPSTQVYLDSERFAGAKRGGSPNLAKIGCVCRLMHQIKGLTPKLSKLGLPDPNTEFAEWMEYELANGWMWNEQGPSVNYSWMHLAPQIGFAVYGEGRAKTLSEDWIRQFFDIIELSEHDGLFIQVGMRSAGHPESDGFLMWMYEFMRTGEKKNKFWAKHFADNQMVLLVLEHEDELRMLFQGMAQRKWPVRVEQHVYQFERGTVAILSKDGNGNTQGRGMCAKIDGRPRAIFPVDGGFRKQGDLDDMTCRLDLGVGMVFYASALFTDGKMQSYSLEGSGKLLHHWIWDKTGLHAVEENELEDVPLPLPPVADPPDKPKRKKKWWQICG